MDRYERWLATNRFDDRDVRRLVGLRSLWRVPLLPDDPGTRLGLSFEDAQRLALGLLRAAGVYPADADAPVFRQVPEGEDPYTARLEDGSVTVACPFADRPRDLVFLLHELGHAAFMLRNLGEFTPATHEVAAFLAEGSAAFVAPDGLRDILRVERCRQDRLYLTDSFLDLWACLERGGDAAYRCTYLPARLAAARFLETGAPDLAALSPEAILDAAQTHIGAVAPPAAAEEAPAIAAAFQPVDGSGCELPTRSAREHRIEAMARQAVEHLGAFGGLEQIPPLTRLRLLVLPALQRGFLRQNASALLLLARPDEKGVPLPHAWSKDGYLRAIVAIGKKDALRPLIKDILDVPRLPAVSDQALRLVKRWRTVTHL